MQQTVATPAQAKKTARQTLREFLTYSGGGKAKPQEVMMFCRQLSSFVRVGIPVTTAISTFAEQTTSRHLRTAYQTIVRDLERGARLSDALADHPKVFPPIVYDMVRSAEMAGNLDTVLTQAAAHIERETAARQRIQAAMIYPAIVLSMAVVICIGIVVFVLPKFKDLYASLGVPAPALLRGLLSFSDYVSAHGLWIAVGFLAAFLLIGYAARTERGHYRIDSLLLRLPVIAPLIQASMTERFCRTLADMLSAGVPISQTFGVVLSNVHNRVYRSALARVGPGMASGHGIFRPLQQTGIFAPSVLQMIRVGEETGHLDQNLGETADMYEQELDFRLKRLTSILEPALIITVGLIVGFVAVAMVTSIYSLAGNYGTGG